MFSHSIRRVLVTSARPLRGSLCLIHPRRTLSHSRAVFAAEPNVNGPLMDAVRNSALFNRLRDSKEATEAIARLGKILQDAGIDPSHPPSKMQLMKLAMNTQVRNEFVEVMEQLRSCGVDLTSPEVQEEMKEIVARAQSAAGDK